MNLQETHLLANFSNDVPNASNFYRITFWT